MATVKRMRFDVGIVEETNLNDKDKKIIDILVQNSRITTTEVAHALNISDVATRRRIKKLEDEKVIRMYTVLLDPRKMGLNIHMHLIIESELDKYDDVLENLMKEKMVVNLMKSVNEGVFFADAWVKDVEDAEKLMKRIGSIEGVRNVKAYIITDLYKFNGVDLRKKGGE